MRIPSFALLTLFFVSVACSTKTSETATQVDSLINADTVVNVEAALTADGPEIDPDQTVAEGDIDAVILNAADENAVRNLVKKGARVNSALLYACQTHNQGLVNELIDAGADLSVALFWAVEFEDVQIAQALITRGAQMTESILEEMRYLVYNMSREDLKERWTEIGGCSKIAYSNNETLKALVVGSMKGKMYSEVWEDGDRPGVANSELIYAAQRGQAAAVEFMIKAGADPNAFTPFCNSALGEAEKNGHQAVAELLKKHEAKKQEGCQ